ncbi:MAG: DUF433 domain-containing protein [Chloroflexi bacterium]|nr:DUF433 domain-containing protein [Chloroflexota bacterium]
MTIHIESLLVRTPDTCDGFLRIAGTRITIHQIVAWYKQGLSPEEIADQYPHISLAQVYAALAYYHANREEVEAELTAEEMESRRLEQSYASS